MLLTDNKWPDDIYVLIPAYQSAALLKLFLPPLIENVPLSHICIVDDGSSDETESRCADYGVCYLRHPVNKGKGAALATGFAYLLDLGAAAIITMDADGQHSPADLPRFIEARRIDPEAGMLIGRRKIQLGYMPFWRICSNRLTSLILSWMTGVSILDSQCGYRLYSARFLKSVSVTCPRFEMESEVVLKAARLGFAIRFVEVQTLYFKRLSHISHFNDTVRWIKAVVRIWRDLRKPENAFSRDR